MGFFRTNLFVGAFVFSVVRVDAQQSVPAAAINNSSSSENQAAAVSVSPLSSAENDYVLCPGDSVEMTVFREPDLRTRGLIAQDGTIQFPLIGEIKLSGLKVRDARESIRKLYDKDYLVTPQIYLDVFKYAQKSFTILGQVQKPGAYDLTGGQRLGLMEAIGMAGGFTRIADKGHIQINRKVNGVTQTLKVNSKKLLKSDAEPFEIQPGDVITIGESWY